MKIELLQPVGSEDISIRSLKAYLETELKDLEVDFEVKIQKNHLTVSLTGEDEELCANFLYKQFGQLLAKKDAISGTDYKGYIQKIEPDKIILYAGFEIELALSSLSELGVGNAGQIAARFGMIPNLPVTFQMSPDLKTAVFSKEQIDQWWAWKKTSTDRIFVNSATRSQVKAALQKKGHGRDVYGVEKLGLTECVIICKENTDGPGIVASIGKLLPSQMGVLIGTKK
ncbi:MAG: DUF2110 family protein [Methanimicrococcus sp.]|nr:DUF2110 family protein [Methanimicrococcus sp.]